MTDKKVKIKCISFEEIIDSTVKGYQDAKKNCPDAQTFEELADWAGKHILLEENKND